LKLGDIVELVVLTCIASALAIIIGERSWQRLDEQVDPPMPPRDFEVEPVTYKF